MTSEMIQELHDKFIKIYKRDFPGLLDVAREMNLSALTLRSFMDGGKITRETFYRIEKYVDEHYRQDIYE